MSLLLDILSFGALWLLVTFAISAVVLVEGEKRAKRDAFADVSDRERVRTLANERMARRELYPHSTFSQEER